MVIIVDPEIKMLLILASVYVLVGGILGWLASLRFTGFGLFGDIAVGILGATIGGILAAWLFPRLGIRFGTGTLRQIIDAVIGGAIVAWIFLAVSHRASSSSFEVSEPRAAR